MDWKKQKGKKQKKNTVSSLKSEKINQQKESSQQFVWCNVPIVYSRKNIIFFFCFLLKKTIPTPMLSTQQPYFVGVGALFGGADILMLARLLLVALFLSCDSDESLEWSAICKQQRQRQRRLWEHESIQQKLGTPKGPQKESLLKTVEKTGKTSVVGCNRRNVFFSIFIKVF